MNPPAEQQQQPEEERGQPFAATNPSVRAVEKAVAKLEESRAAIERDLASGREDIRDVRDRLTKLEGVASGVSETLKEASPKIDDILGFIKHAMPEVSRKSDLSALQQEIEKRPTRRQSIFDLIAFISFIGVVVALTLHYAK